MQRKRARERKKVLIDWWFWWCLVGRIDWLLCCWNFESKLPSRRKHCSRRATELQTDRIPRIASHTDIHTFTACRFDNQNECERENCNHSEFLKRFSNFLFSRAEHCWAGRRRWRRSERRRQRLRSSMSSFLKHVNTFEKQTNNNFLKTSYYHMNQYVALLWI